MRHKCDFVWIGIDPGKKGSLAILKEDNNIYFFDWPSDGNLTSYFACLLDTIHEYKVQLAALERVHAMPKQGVASMFTFGENYGMWRAFLILNQIRHTLVTPQTWSKGLFSKSDGLTTKQRAANAALRLYPNAELTNSRGTFLDGRGDALMIAHYARVQSNGLSNAQGKEDA